MIAAVRVCFISINWIRLIVLTFFLNPCRLNVTPETPSSIKSLVFLKPFFFVKLVKSVRWFEILLLSPSKSSSRDKLKYKAVIFTIFAALCEYYSLEGCLQDKFAGNRFPNQKRLWAQRVVCAHAPSI